jgi:hypothetical protein
MESILQFGVGDAGHGGFLQNPVKNNIDSYKEYFISS